MQDYVTPTPFEMGAGNLQELQLISRQQKSDFHEEKAASEGTLCGITSLRAPPHASDPSCLHPQIAMNFSTQSK